MRLPSSLGLCEQISSSRIKKIIQNKKTAPLSCHYIGFIFLNQIEKILGMHRYYFFTNRYVTDTFICVLADTEYRYRYFLDLVSMKEVQLIWRQFLFPPLKSQAFSKAIQNEQKAIPSQR